MSTPNRTVAGLTPMARPVVEGLVRRERDLAAGTPAHAREQAEPVVQQRAAAETQAQDAQGSAAGNEPVTSAAPEARPARRRTDSKKTKHTRPAGTAQIALDIDANLRAEARAAFRAASYFEGVGTWAAFVERALESEIQRMRKRYNDGKPFEPITENLARGRRAK